MDRFTEEDVRNTLAPYHARIKDVIRLGLDEWLAVAECRTAKSFAPVLYPRTITNYVFDAIARNARTIFSADTSVQVLDEAQTVKFCFGTAVVGRFKKGDEDNLGQNIETQAVLNFIDPQQTLPGFPPEAAKVEFVWAANDILTEIQSVMVVARDGDRVLWSYSIDDADEGASVIKFPTPTAPDDDDLPLVAAKARRAEQNSEGT